ncbi:MAG: MATE family efflux transporter [Clostridiales bacterium]|nr:MAG: MATE family efflux transporter [Clostridiales bacterium]
MTYDLTAGKPLRRILVFAAPLLVGNIFQQLYSMVDTIIVGQTISTRALSGVGATGAISFLIIGFVQGLTAGFSILTSQFFGGKDTENVRRSVGVSYKLSVYFSIIITIVAVATAMPLLRLMQTPETILPYAYDYIVTIYMGLSATVFYNIVSYQLRAVGDSRTPLYFLIFASLLNVGLDFLFILYFHMGVAGAGWATVISQALAGMGSLLVLLKKFPAMRPKLADIRWDPVYAMRLVRLGLPMALQFSITAIGVMVQQAALNRLGDVAVAAYTAANKMDNLATQAMVALGTALATFCGQNFGAGRFDRIRTGVKQTMLVTAGYAVVGAVVVISLAKPLTYLFVNAQDATPELLGLVEQFIFFQGVFYIALGAIFCYRNALQGMGYSTLTMIGGAIELVMRALAAFVLAAAFGYIGVCLSNPAAWVGADLFFIPAYCYLLNKRLREMQAAPQTETLLMEQECQE